MVCMERGSPRILGHARNLVTKMFAGIDIEISWWGRGDCPLEAIRIILKVATPPDEQPGALAYAFPYEGTHIVVFYDRIEQEVPQSRVPTLTAHVIAHEFAHLLEGVNRHSQNHEAAARGKRRGGSAGSLKHEQP